MLLAVTTILTADAVLFDCHFGSSDFIDYGIIYECSATVTLTGSTTLESVTGLHQNGYTNDNVTALFINQQNLPFIPQRISNIFKNLRVMRYWSTNMVSINAEDLRPFPQIEHLQFFQNNFTSLDGDLFSHNPILDFLYLGSNQIRHIGQNLVTNLNHLRYLDLTANLCINTGAFNQGDVQILGQQLSVMCPPLDITTTQATTTVSTSTNQPIEECSCVEEIDELREENQQRIAQQDEKIVEQNLIIEQLQQSNNQMEARLIEIEAKLRELGSIPCTK